MACTRSDTFRSRVSRSDAPRSGAPLRGIALAGCAAALLLAADADAQRPGDPREHPRDPWAPPELPELLEHSQIVVAGEVLEMNSQWSPDRTTIFTTVTLRPDRRFKGGGQNLVRFRIPGGTVGDTQVMVTHQAQFRVGERALVFLAGRSGRLPEVVAGAAGKRHLRAGEDGAERILPGFALAEAAPGARPRVIVTLDEFAAALPRIQSPSRR